MKDKKKKRKEMNNGCEVMCWNSVLKGALAMKYKISDWSRIRK